MAIEGTVLNGVIVLEGAVKLPEGARVLVELAEVDDDDLAPPPEPYDREQELAILREAIEDVKAGRGVPFEEAMAELARKHNLPPVEAPAVAHRRITLAQGAIGRLPRIQKGVSWQWKQRTSE